MGLTIHYSGSFRKNAGLSEMIEEVKDIAEVQKWKYTIFEDQFPKNGFSENTNNRLLYGICFTPPKCETVFISFLSDGRMSSPVHLMLSGKSDEESEKVDSSPVFVKTQYAGVEVHKFIIQLFHYLDKKYFKDFHMFDEGQYWETGDEKLLHDIFKRYNDLIENFANALENNLKNTDESFESYFQRLLKQLAKKKRNDN